MDQKIKISEKHFPHEAFPFINEILDQNEFRLKIVRSRTTKFADFKPPCKINKIPTITINNNLNPYLFLITFLHEFAHFQVWKERKFYAKPHGRTWKNNYSKLIQAMINMRVFPEVLSHRLTEHIQNPKATSCTDTRLYKILSTFDAENKGVFVDDIPDGAVFKTHDGQVFKKEKKIRKRILCTNQKKNRKYLFSPIYKVFPLEKEEYRS